MEKASHKKGVRIAVAALVAVNLTLAIIAVLLFVGFPQKGVANTPEKGVADVAPCDFELSVRPYDINPGCDYIVYTNYACPHCAAFYFGAHAEGLEYTSRILMLEESEGAFATQRTVSAYMLKLSRVDKKRFDALERELFLNQDEWTGHSDGDVLAWLNTRSGMDWVVSDLADEMGECDRIESEAPADLPYVPGLYGDHERLDGKMRELVDRGTVDLEKLQGEEEP